MSLNYETSGVNIKTGNDFIDVIKDITKNEIIGGFSGIYEHNNLKLVASTDGVGTKLLLCKALNKYNTIGIDLVAMCVNDIICSGATPLFFLDYYATGELKLDIAKEIIIGIQEGCKLSNCMLIGGETAELPRIYNNEQFDLAGFSVGIIEGNVFPKKIKEGNLIYGIPSTGVHSNGYSLIHKLLEKEQYDLNTLLTPTKIYVPEINHLINQYGNGIQGICHITGGGIIENVTRILDSGLNICLNQSWEIHDVFKWIYNKSDMTKDNMLSTYNCGIGMVVIIDDKMKDKIENEENLILLGKIITSIKPEIDYDKIDL